MFLFSRSQELENENILHARELLQRKEEEDIRRLQNSIRKEREERIGKMKEGKHTISQLMIG